MSDYTGEVKREVVKIRIKSAMKPTFWYASKIGKTVEALREVKTIDGATYTVYKQWPRPTGFNPSGDYTAADVEEV